jgi:hypothetical protein
MRDCKGTSLLGTLKAFVWRLEYQQRGRRHAHIFFWIDADASDIQEMDNRAIHQGQKCARLHHTLMFIFQFINDKQS